MLNKCDRLDGLFHAQDVKDVFINGLSEIIQSHVRVLDGQFPKRTLADTISAAQMYWDGTNKLRLSLKLPRLQTTKVAYASPCQPGIRMSTAPSRLPNRGRGPVPLLRQSRLGRGPTFDTTVTSSVTLLRNALSRIGHVNAATLLIP